VLDHRRRLRSGAPDPVASSGPAESDEPSTLDVSGVDASGREASGVEATGVTATADPVPQDD
jgi:hypothetical protein